MSPQEETTKQVEMSSRDRHATSGERAAAICSPCDDLYNTRPAWPVIGGKFVTCAATQAVIHPAAACRTDLTAFSFVIHIVDNLAAIQQSHQAPSCTSSNRSRFSAFEFQFTNSQFVWLRTELRLCWIVTASSGDWLIEFKYMVSSSVVHSASWEGYTPRGWESERETLDPLIFWQHF